MNLACAANDPDALADSRGGTPLATVVRLRQLLHVRRRRVPDVSSRPRAGRGGGSKRALAALLASIVFLGLPRVSLAEIPKKRAMPDYDGRGGQPKTLADHLLWVPRIVLFPVYLATEYLVRRPVGAVVIGAERAGIIEPDSPLLTPEESRFSFAPLVAHDLGLRPRIGAHVTWNNALVRDNDVHARVGFGGIDWVSGALADRIQLNHRSALEIRVSAFSRPEVPYFGTGYDSRKANISRYGADGIDARATLDIQPTQHVSISGGSGLRVRWFDDGGFAKDDQLSEAVAKGEYATPDSFTEGYVAGVSEARVALDSRAGRTKGSGFRVVAEGSQGSAPRPSRAWVRYGGSATAFVDLNHRSRVVSLSFAAAFSDSLTSSPVPFTELTTLGGNDLMTGFLPGRLLGRSATAATLAYEWPVWVSLKGTLQASVGNVFGAHLEDFEVSRLRFSGAVGVEASQTSEDSFRVLFGVGSEPFESGGKIDSVRINIGTTRGI